MSRALLKYDPYELREKQARYYREARYDEKPMEKRQMAKTENTKIAETVQEELDFDNPIVGESKNARFKRVVNYRLTKAVERLRMIRQMFEGTTANNYEFTEEQMGKLTKALFDEVNEINRLMARRLDKRGDDIPQI